RGWSESAWGAMNTYLSSHASKYTNYQDWQVAYDAGVEAERAAHARLREALRRLVTRLDAVHADEAYSGVWVLHQAYVGPYAGPTYTAELDAARAALAEEVEDRDAPRR